MSWRVCECECECGLLLNNGCSWLVAECALLCFINSLVACAAPAPLGCTDS